MVGSDYLARQAATLLRLAKVTSDAKLAARLAAKAADLKAQADADLSAAPVNVASDKNQ